MVGIGGIVDPVGAGVGAGVTAEVDGAGGIVVPLGAGVDGVGAVLGVGGAEKHKFIFLITVKSESNLH